MSSSCILCTKCVYMHGMVYEYVCVCMCVWSGHSLEGGTMAFLCSELQVAVETQSQTKPCWHTECRECRMLLPPSGDAGQNRAIVPDWLWAINAPQPPSVTNTYAQKYQYTLTEWIMEIFTYNFYFQMNIQSSKGKNKSTYFWPWLKTEKIKTSWFHSL